MVEGSLHLLRFSLVKGFYVLQRFSCKSAAALQLWPKYVVLNLPRENKMTVAPWVLELRST